MATVEFLEILKREHQDGTFLTIKFAAPNLRRQGGSVIVPSSVNATRMLGNSGRELRAFGNSGRELRA